MNATWGKDAPLTSCLSNWNSREFDFRSRWPVFISASAPKLVSVFGCSAGCTLSPCCYSFLLRGVGTTWDPHTTCCMQQELFGEKAGLPARDGAKLWRYARQYGRYSC